MAEWNDDRRSPPDTDRGRRSSEQQGHSIPATDAARAAKTNPAERLLNARNQTGNTEESRGQSRQSVNREIAPHGRLDVSEQRAKIGVSELNGVITVTIPAREYGEAGEHWRRVLSGPNHGGYGDIYIQRFGAVERRANNLTSDKSYAGGLLGIDFDECPGAMFVYTGDPYTHVEWVNATDNRRLGRDLGHALREFKQVDQHDLWQVLFRFV